MLTDPPYGISFMGNDWDKAVPPVGVWKECLRVLKPGAFAFVMSLPRLDVLSQMSVRLQEAGFHVDFTPLFWAFASGFPKATNISKAVDKHARRDYVEAAMKLGIKPKSNASWRDWTVGEHSPSDKYWEAFKVAISSDDWQRIEGEVIGKGRPHVGAFNSWGSGYKTDYSLTAPATPEAKALDGSYTGFQPKPALEVIIVAMKPLSEKTYVEQALKNGKGITWLDDARIPFQNKPEIEFLKGRTFINQGDKFGGYESAGEDVSAFKSEKGRFPANLIVSDDVLNDSNSYAGGFNPNNATKIFNSHELDPKTHESRAKFADEGSFSRYFSLDAWWGNKVKELPESVRKTFPFLIEPKASKEERNEGLESFPLGESPASTRSKAAEGRQNPLGNPRQNYHPTVKPIAIMSYLITLGSRRGDIVLDPFAGSGTTVMAAKMLGRKGIGIEINSNYAKIAEARVQSIATIETWIT